jgi:hypothetical protein
VGRRASRRFGQRRLSSDQSVALAAENHLMERRKADAPAPPKRAMTALPARRLSVTRNGRGTATALNTWLRMEHKKSPDRKATSTAAERADAGGTSRPPYGTQTQGYCIELKFMVRFNGIAALSIVDPTICERDAARAWERATVLGRPHLPSGCLQPDGTCSEVPALPMPKWVAEIAGIAEIRRGLQCMHRPAKPSVLPSRRNRPATRCARHAPSQLASSLS